MGGDTAMAPSRANRRPRQRGPCVSDSPTDPQPEADAPPAAAITDAELVLAGLGAVDEEGRATDLGRRLARVPADPRLARALLDGAALVGASTPV